MGCSALEPAGVAREPDRAPGVVEMKQPSTDSADYKSFTLEQNGLAVLLCSDARAEKAAAAMNVRRIIGCTCCYL